MATGLFVNFTLSEVLQIQAKARDMLMEGKTIMSYGDQGTSVSKVFTMNVREVLAECIYALQRLDPDTYGSPRDKRRVSGSFRTRFPL